MRAHTFRMLLILSTIAISLYAEKHRSQVAVSENYNRTCWGNNHLPESSGLKLSDNFGGITFTGRYASYTNADTWYLTYGTDDTMYSCWTEGSVNGKGTGISKDFLGKERSKDAPTCGPFEDMSVQRIRIR